MTWRCSAWSAWRAAFRVGALRRHRAQELANAGDFAGAAALARQERADEAAELSTFWSLAADHIVEGSVVEPSAFVAGVAERLPSWVDEGLQLTAKWLLRERRFAEALQLCFSTAASLESLGSQAALLALRLLEEAMLHGEYDFVQREAPKVVQGAARMLSVHPSDARLRIRLLQILGPQSLGASGMAMLASVLLDLAAAPVDIKSEKPLALRAQPCDEVCAPRTDRAGCALVARASTLRAWHPRVSTGDAAGAVDAGSLALENLSILTAGHIEEHGRETILLTLALVYAIAPLSSAPDHDIVILRAVASQAARNGSVQLARDLAEQALVLASSSAGAVSTERARLAWLAYADGASAHLGNIEELSLQSLALLQCAHHGNGTRCGLKARRLSGFYVKSGSRNSHGQ